MSLEIRLEICRDFQEVDALSPYFVSHIETKKKLWKDTRSQTSVKNINKNHCCRYAGKFTEWVFDGRDTRILCSKILAWYQQYFTLIVHQHLQVGTVPSRAVYVLRAFQDSCQDF